MLCWITILGGALIMMGQHDRSEALFYYFRLEDQVPDNHLLRLIDKHISFEFVRESLATALPPLRTERRRLRALLRKCLSYHFLSTEKPVGTNSRRRGKNRWS